MTEITQTASELVADYDDHLRSWTAIEGTDASRSRNAIRSAFADQLRDTLEVVSADREAMAATLAAVENDLKALLSDQHEDWTQVLVTMLTLIETDKPDLVLAQVKANALREAAESLNKQPPRLKAQYVESLRRMALRIEQEAQL